MGNQYGGGMDGHEIDEAIYLVSGYILCRHCGTGLTYGLQPDCVPFDWKQQNATDRYYWSALSLVEASVRYASVVERIEKDRARGLIPERSM